MPRKKSQQPKVTPPVAQGTLAELTNPKQRAFLAAFANTGNVTLAAECAEISRRSHQLWLKEEGPAGDLYRAAFAEAKDEAADRLEAEARRRAVEGVTRTKQIYFHNGQEVDRIEETVYSDALLIFLLKGVRPETYRERSEVQHTGRGGGPIEIEAKLDHEIKQLMAELAAASERAAARQLAGEGAGQESGPLGVEPDLPADPLQLPSQPHAPGDGPGG